MKQRRPEGSALFFAKLLLCEFVQGGSANQVRRKQSHQTETLATLAVVIHEDDGLDIQLGGWSFSTPTCRPP